MTLGASIVKTISFFDLFDYPLTRAEIWKYLLGEATLAESEAAIDALLVDKKIEEKDGLVFLPGRFSITETRASRYRFAARKWRRARRFAKIFSALPGVRLVGVGNTLSYGNAKDGSDIDFFVVVRRGTIWRTRIACAALAAALGLRPRRGDNRDKLCLSFFVSENVLDLSALTAAVPTDVYLASWISQMVPLSGQEESYGKFLAANAWAKKIFPNAFADRGVVAAPGFLRFLFFPLALLPGGFIKGAQERRFPEAIRAASRRADGSVVISDEVLKFHVDDRRKEIYDRWMAKSSPFTAIDSGQP